MMRQIPRHKVFVSFHHKQDQKYKDRFVQMMGKDMVDKSVSTGDIKNLNGEATLQRIREDYISDATVTIVLIGCCTWKRKHVDWEIGASLRDTEKNPGCGLLGIWLPEHPDFGKKCYDPHLIPPRLADNCGEKAPYARVYNWTDQTARILEWIHRAYLRRKKPPYPNNGRHPFGKNWRGKCSDGWQGQVRE